ncbi:MAG: formate/nitrite transporter family protein [Eggerthellales bacterium]|nr:formate/nitrite transporter family protein [Eggerthellales bacterium]
MEEKDISAMRPDALAPAAIQAKAEGIGVTKAAMPALNTVVLAVLAGMFIGCGAMLFTLVQGDAELPFAVKRILGGFCFSVGLMLVVVCGAELFTGNNLMAGALLSKKITWGGMLRNWALVWLGNFAGSLLMVALVFGSAMAAMNGGGVGDAMVSIAVSKVTPDGLTLFCKAILCNFLVCLAVWMTFAGRTVADKLLACVMPIIAFVACGFEHSVANMFFMFMGLCAKGVGFGGGVDASALDLAGIFGNLGIVTLGNIVGGAVLVALLYWLAYGRVKSGK